ncbi:HNH endonuclease [Enterobacter mori]|uniref:HNH endonuclease n=1 Tax=Enterobacter mori TaxID=539813 RepID=UPI00398B4437
MYYMKTSGKDRESIKAFQENQRQLKEALLSITDNHCAYCGCKLDMKTIHIDHVIPQCENGSDHISNLNASCKTCNLKKGKKSLSGFRLMQRWEKAYPGEDMAYKVVESFVKKGFKLPPHRFYFEINNCYYNGDPEPPRDKDKFWQDLELEALCDLCGMDLYFKDKQTF